MSAWLDLVNYDGSDEWLELLSAALVEVQVESVRRSAAWLTAEYSGPNEDKAVRRAAERLLARAESWEQR